MGKFGDFRALVPTLRKQGVVVERELAKIREQAKDYPSARRDLAAMQYYLHLAISECQRRWRDYHRGVTNYVSAILEGFLE
jgi:hypothetical protein